MVGNIKKGISLLAFWIDDREKLVPMRFFIGHYASSRTPQPVATDHVLQADKPNRVEIFCYQRGRFRGVGKHSELVKETLENLTTLRKNGCVIAGVDRLQERQAVRLW
jgi:hypothetical protein